MTPIILGLIAIAIAIVSYSFYFYDVFQGKTKPHGLTWLIWSVLNTLICYQQLHDGAGPGAWVTGVAAIANFAIFISSFRYGERNITRFDWVCGALAAIAIVIWLYSPNGAISTILACLVFIIGLIPTFRKSLYHANEETVVTFALNGLKFLVALFALQSFSVGTALYPLVLFVINILFASFLIVRSYRLKLA